MRSVLLAVSLFTSVAWADAPLQTAGEVDLQRYQGTWYEIARKPLFFQRKCVASEAVYALNNDGSVAVNNRCTSKSGKTITATGTATPQEPGRTDKLGVVFDNWFSNLFPKLTRGDYWVMHIDENYQNVLVGEPRRKYLWLMSREPNMDEATKDQLLNIAREQGYQLDDLIWRKDQKSSY